METFNEECLYTQIEDDVNILLLGETGVGKSTFINSFVNYLQFDTFEEVCANVDDMQCLIPTKFTIIDDEFNERVLHFGSGTNENTAAGESATLKTKTYVFNLPNYNMNFRIIDTPGIGDTRGIDQDHINQENIINTLSNVKYINAICVLLKPNQPRCTIAFQYCINQLLMCLHKVAVNNIVFVFTNTSNSFFTPGETTHSLQKVLKDIEDNQNIKIPFSKENTFCVDNESFRYLLAQKSDFNMGNEKIFLNSWVHSHNEYLRIIRYTINLIPYNTDYSLYLFNVRNTFEKLCQSLTDTNNILKSDSCLLKKLQSIIDENPDEVMDAQNHRKEVETRISKYEQDKNDYIIQISKLVTFLQTNSIIVFNSYTQNYISYLIDRENSMGLSTDRKHVRLLYDLMKFHESINNIVKMDMHCDPFSPIMTREELSSVFPHLEDVKSMYNVESNSEIQFSVMQTVKEENCEPESTHLDDVEAVYNVDNSEVEDSVMQNVKEENCNQVSTEEKSGFSFASWFNSLSEAATHIAQQVENSLDYEELRKQSIKKGFSLKTNEHNMNRNNVSNKPYIKSHSNFKHKPNQNESHITNNFVMISKNTNSPTPVKHKPKQNNQRGTKPFNKTPTSNKSSEFSDCYSDNFVVIKTPQQTKSRGTGYGRSRGRGSHGTSRQSANSTKNEMKSQSHNKGQQTNRQRGAKTKTDINKATDNPNSLLHSMKTLFD